MRALSLTICTLECNCPPVAQMVFRASSTEQVEENCRKTEININDETYRRLNELTKHVRASLYS